MNFRLKSLLIKHSHNQGIALPFALSIGVLMIVAGTMMILRSQTAPTHVKAQQSTLEDINIAQVGATRIFALINQNPYLAMYPDCISRDGSGNCTDSGTEDKQRSWANAANFPEIIVCDSQAATNLENLSLNQHWQLIDPNDPQQGEYRLVSYEYDNPGIASGKGKLTVEGRLNNHQTPLTSISQITFEIPVSLSPIKETPITGVDCNLPKTVINFAVDGNNQEDDSLTTTSEKMVLPKPGDTPVNKSINR